MTQEFKTRDEQIWAALAADTTHGFKKEDIIPIPMEDVQLVPAAIHKIPQSKAKQRVFMERKFEPGQTIPKKLRKQDEDALDFQLGLQNAFGDF